MLDLSEYIIWCKHASVCACMLCACMHRPIFQPDWVWLERSRYLWKQENILDLGEHIVWPEHTNLHAQFKLCAETVLACSPHSIDTLIFLIRDNLAEIWACAHKDIAWMHAILHALFKLCTQTGLACSSNSIDTLIFLIRPSMTEIWAGAHKHVGCMHTSLRAQDKLCDQTGPASSHSWIHRYLDLSNQTQSGWNMGLCTQGLRMHASKLACSGQTMCSCRSGMFSWFHC